MEGVLLIDKPKGLTSTQVVEKVKKKIRRKVGHTGTLDPIATGLLILLIGRATRFTWVFQGLSKTYEFVVQFGAETDTYDAEGKVVKVYEGHLNCEKLKELIPSFRGEVEQTPPPFSAKKVRGKRAYELARKGVAVELKPIKVYVYDFELLECNSEDKTATFAVEISSGGYVRSLAHELGKKLGIGGYVKELRRVKIDEIHVSEAVSLEEFLNSEHPEEYIQPVDKVMRFLPAIKLNSFQVGKVLKGQSLLVNIYDYNGLVRIYDNDKFIGVGELQGGVLKPRRLLV